MDGSPSHCPEQPTPPTAEPVVEAPPVEPAQQPAAEEGAKHREGKKRKRRGSRAQKHKNKQATARRPSAPSEGASPRRSQQWAVAVLSDQRVTLRSPSEPTQPLICDDRRQSVMDMTTEAQNAAIEAGLNQEAQIGDHDDESATQAQASKHPHYSRHNDHSLTNNMEPLSCVETRPALRCPPHPFSEIVASLKTTAHETTGRKAVDRDQSLKYCVVVSLLVLVCLYYAGFLAAYALLSARPPHRPPASSRTIELSYTQWVFRPRTSREPARRTSLAPADARGAPQEDAELPSKTALPHL